MNNAAIDQGVQSLVKIEVPEAWKTVADEAPVEIKHASQFVKDVVIPMNRLEGDNLPVSAFTHMPDGTFEAGTAAFEKRGIAVNVPEWNSDKCIQCNQCSMVCPHAAIRPFLVNESEKANAPESAKIVDAKGLKTDEKLYFAMGITPLDCSGCGNCALVCPVDALEMKPAESQKDQADAWDYLIYDITDKKNPLAKDSVKGSQFETTTS